jgi:hypothetical protein
MTIELDGVNNTLKTDKIEPQSGTALQVGASGDTITLPSGATLNIAGTISNSGTATGFGAIDWQTSDIKTSTFTAVAGKGYLVNTTGGAITVNLPAGSAGAQVALVDYAGTWDTNNCTLSANGSEKIEGQTNDIALENERESIVLLYQDSTQGWIAIGNSDGRLLNPTYIVASGGTVTTSGDYKIHTFDSDGTFTVSSIGNSAGGGDTVSYAVIAGGGGGGAPQSGNRGGGGGGGGYREGAVPTDPYYPARSPIAATSGLTVAAGGYPISVGGGGAGGTGQPNTANPGQIGTNGGVSTFSSITSAGGGGGGGGSPPGGGSPAGSVFPGQQGGSGGGGGGGGCGPGTCARGGGDGNVPPVSPPQGSKGGAGGNHPGNPGPPDNAGGGGGGAAARGGSTTPPAGGGDGGNGVGTSISGSNVNYSGGGVGIGSGSDGSAGTGGVAAGSNGGDNSGAGGPPGPAPAGPGKTGGSGRVVIRYKYQN